MPETYTYTGTQLATEVKNQFGDTGGVQITDAMILNWINNGQRRISASNPFNEQVFTTNLLADQSVYNLQALMTGARVQSYSAIVVNGTKVSVIPWQEYQDKIEARTLASGADRTPQFASEFGGKLTIWPAPASSVVQGITIYYVGWPDDLTTLADPLEIPDRFYNALVDYVFAKALELDENFEASQVMMQQHTEQVSMELQRDKMDPTDYYPSITFEPRW